MTTAQARTRPRYGDTLRVQTEAVTMSGDSSPDVLVGPVFETLMNVANDGSGRPGLAHDCTAAGSSSHWVCQLRNDVLFHDGQMLNAATVVRALAKASGLPCKATPSNDAVAFDCDSPQPNLPQLLSLPQFAISSMAADGTVVGTGPFRIDRRTATGYLLKANDDYWAGRPFLDGIEMTTSRNSHDQMTDFSLDRADVIEISPEQWRRAQQERLRMSVSRPSEGIFVVVDSAKPELRDARLRQAIAMAIDRTAIHNVILQRQGEMAAGLLPNWLTGYEFLFDASNDLTRARQLRLEVGPVPALTIAYSPSDSLGRLIAERVALNARDAGLSMQAVPGTTPGTDLHIRTLPLASLSAPTALNNIIDRLNIMPLAASPTMESLFNNERAALQTYAAIPLVYLPRTAALKDRVHNWVMPPDGTWHFDQVWLTPRRTEVRP
jgi:MarR-like DNA-binding transcriptional regulator SgrR of sgrS sRNA